jgi:hypothetical protein
MKASVIGAALSEHAEKQLPLCMWHRLTRLTGYSPAPDVTVQDASCPITASRSAGRAAGWRYDFQHSR